MSKYDIHKNKELPNNDEINKYKNFDKVMKKAALYDYKQATKPIYKNVRVLSIIAVVLAVGLVILVETTEQEEETEQLIKHSDTLNIQNQTPIKDTIDPKTDDQIHTNAVHPNESINQHIVATATTTTTPSEVMEENQPIETIVLKNFTAEFKGGENALKAFLEKNIKYPYNAVESAYSGKVEVDVVIEKTGNVSNFTIYHSPNAAISNEIKRVIKLMPEWNAAVKNNSAVASTVTINFPFTYLEDH